MMVLLVFLSSTHAVLLEFENCLDTAIIDSDPRELQFIPLNVSAALNMTNSLYPLDIIVYGNVSGTAPGNSSQTEIIDLDVANNNYSTLKTSIQVASFIPYSEPTRFCDSVNQGECPLGPQFDGNV